MYMINPALRCYDVTMRHVGRGMYATWESIKNVSRPLSLSLALSRAHSSPLPGIDCGGGQVRSFGRACFPSSSMRERPPKGEGGEPVPGEGTNEHRVGARGRNLGWGLEWSPHHNKGRKQTSHTFAVCTTRVRRRICPSVD